MRASTDDAINTIDTSEIYIKDIVVVSKSAPPQPHNPTGEFGLSSHFSGRQLSPNEIPEKMLDRLYDAIELLIKEAANQHRDNCMLNSNELLPHTKNNITRVLTNEFFFYTGKPLTQDQFQQIMQKISDYAKSQPVNLHIMLGSFAVLTHHGKVMNVFPHIECGPQPIINLAVKNYPSGIDPVYDNRPNVSIKDDDISNINITIDNQAHPFSFNTVFNCKTAGKTSFFPVLIFA